MRVDNNLPLGSVNNGQLFSGIYPMQNLEDIRIANGTYVSENNGLMIVRVIAGPNAPTGFAYKVYNGILVGSPVISAPIRPRARFD